MFGDPQPPNPPTGKSEEARFIFFPDDDSRGETETAPPDQPPIEEFRALGLDLGSDDAKAQRIKGALCIIQGRAEQGHPSICGYTWFDFAAPKKLSRFWTDCYHAVAREIVDAGTTPKVIDKTIPFFLAEYGSRYVSQACSKYLIASECHGAILEWKGKLLRLTAKGTAAKKPKNATANDVSELERRGKLLDDYVKRTGASHKSIYEGNSGIHKPQFYQWRRGKLPRSSATAKNFERFLRDQKAPVPRRAKA